MPKNLFLPLRKSLKVIDIRINLLNPDLKLMNYPVSLSELHNLVELKMDLLRDKPLPKEYKDMKHLQRLVFTDGRPNVVSLKDDTFDAVSNSNISEIHLIGLNIRVIGPRTFSKLSKLRILNLSNNPQLDAHLGEIGPSLRNTSIEVLRLNNTAISNEGDSSLISTKLEHFCGLPLKELTLDSNYLHDFKPFLHKCFPFLEILSLGDNYIMTYNIMRSDIIKLRHLVGFNISFQRRIADFTHSDMDGWSTAMHENKYNQKVKRTKRNGHICEKGMACPYRLPKKLEWIDVSHNGVVTVNIPEVVLLGNTSLKYLKASYCGIQTATLPMYCPWKITPQIETLDLSNNNLQCVNATFFDGSITGCNWTSLKYLGFLGVTNWDK